MKLKMFFGVGAFLLFFISQASALTICEYGLEISKTNDVNLLNINTFPGIEEPDLSPSSKYQFIIKNSEDEAVYLRGIPVFFGILDADEEVDAIPVSVRVPCSEDAERLDITLGGKPIFSSDIANLLCNKDTVCNGFETSLRCSDCPQSSSDGWCDRIKDNRCDPDCRGVDIDCGIVDSFVALETSGPLALQGETADKQKRPEEPSVDGSLGEKLPIQSLQKTRSEKNQQELLLDEALIGELCNKNGICDENEDSQTCPIECPPSDGQIEQHDKTGAEEIITGVAPQAESGDNASFFRNRKPLLAGLILLVTAILVIGIAIRFIRRRRSYEFP
ncbi:hypothetical protein HYU14_00800 [Candidatus Woesearchaeota archaeon]|nr:hypothetical protein [Candidatus Woesearchaeota archaeon]